jgi:peptidoglycan/xylan/chitin deacetylase (PgdA/CDA1 family)
MAGIVTAVVLMTFAYRVFLTIPLKIDGSDARLNVGTHVSDLRRDGRLHGVRGNLVAVKDHKVLRAGGGGAPYALVNGKIASDDQQLYASDVIQSMNGTDAVEPIAKRTEPVPAPTQYQGSGPLETVLNVGKSGTREVEYGTLSKQVVSAHVVLAPVARVIERSAPRSGAKVVALTFDDGPWPGQTEAVLKILQKYGIKATFFEIGAQAKGRPKLSKMIADAGMLLGNHSETHPNLSKCSPDRVAREMVQAEANIERASGQHPRYFRPPGGDLSATVWGQAKKMDLKVVNWDIDTRDWSKPGVPTIVSRVLNGIRPGSVVLMHDGGGDRSQTIKALPTIIEGLKKMGYSFVTLDGIAELPSRMG